MAAIDYEVEYNNRARVPDHPEIFARWAREAEEYRLLAMEERRAELGLAYSSTPRQFIDLFWPTSAEKAPLALFIHGGYWKSLEPVDVQPDGARPQCPRHRRRGRRLQSLPAGHRLRHHRGDASRLPVSLAAHRTAHAGLRPFRRRSSRRRDGGDRLAHALSEDAGRFHSRGLFDLRAVRSHPAA